MERNREMAKTYDYVKNLLNTAPRSMVNFPKDEGSDLFHDENVDNVDEQEAVNLVKKNCDKLKMAKILSSDDENYNRERQSKQSKNRYLTSPGSPDQQVRWSTSNMNHRVPSPFALRQIDYSFPEGHPYLPGIIEMPLPNILESTTASGADDESLIMALARGPRKSRGEKKPIPEELKDDKYFEKRKKNNLAAKKSRDARKLREDGTAKRAHDLEKDNAVLTAQVMQLREEAVHLRQMLEIRKPQRSRENKF